jgi:putative membrane protein
MSELTVPPGDSTKRDRNFWILNAAVSTLALAVLAYLLLLRQGQGDRQALSFMPAVNASFNAIAACCLVVGVLAIRAKNQARHQAAMLAAFASSSFFLAGYLAYHYVHGDTRYPAGAPFRGFYLALLATHVLLSIPVVPMALASFYFAFQKRFDRHKRITKVLFPIWLYVSITGVVVFGMLRSFAH